MKNKSLCDNFSSNTHTRARKQPPSGPPARTATHSRLCHKQYEILFSLCRNESTWACGIEWNGMVNVWLSAAMCCRCVWFVCCVSVWQMSQRKKTFFHSFGIFFQARRRIHLPATLFFLRLETFPNFTKKKQIKFRLMNDNKKSIEISTHTCHCSFLFRSVRGSAKCN